MSMQVKTLDPLYTPDGYLDFDTILDAGFFCTIIVGARGCGKTYGSLRKCLERGIVPMYLRRTQKQLKLIAKPNFQPYKAINRDTGREIVPALDGDDMGLFVDEETDQRVGYLAALSTFGNIRGFDGSDIDIMILDEFIPEATERMFFDQAEALFNAQETINRNREFTGSEPVRLMLLSNSNTIYGDIISSLMLGGAYARMQSSGIECMADEERSILLIRPRSDVFREKKQETALYKLTAGTRFSEMALDNEFIIQDERLVKARPLNEYKPIASINGIGIWRHKHRSGEYYVTWAISGAVKEYNINTPADVDRYKRECIGAAIALEHRKIYFQDVDTQTRFYQIYKA